MPKFNVYMYYTVTYSHAEQIEAKTKEEAEAKAQQIFENADCQEEWKLGDGGLEMDVLEVMEE